MKGALKVEVDSETLSREEIEEEIKPENKVEQQWQKWITEGNGEVIMDTDGSLKRVYGMWAFAVFGAEGR